MRNTAVLLLSFILSMSELTFAQAADNIVIIPLSIQRVLEGHNLPDDSYSFKVKELYQNSSALSVNASSMLNPASSIKTITTLVALEELGPTYVWQTDIYALGNINNGTLNGDLLIKGGGDPFLVVEDFWNLLKTIKRRGITKITGDLIIDQSFFDVSNLDPGSFDGQGNRTYNVIPNALLLNFQAVNFYFYPHVNGRDVIIRTNPELANLKIDNRLTQVGGGCGGYQRGIAFDKSNTDFNTVIFSGRHPTSCSEYRMARSVMDAPNYALGLFQQLWAEMGGEFDGQLIQASPRIPEEQVPFVRWSSAPLSDVITSINKFSNNVMVRHLLLTLAAEKSEDAATVENGINIIEEYLADKQLDSSQINMVNGAGLARDVRISANLMIDLLEHGASIPFSAEYISSLPISGMDGTMRSRFRQGRAAGNMHIKTGTLDETSAVAGYVESQSGKRYAVVGMLNHELADRGPGVELMNALLQWVYEQ